MKSIAMTYQEAKEVMIAFNQVWEAELFARLEASGWRKP